MVFWLVRQYRVPAEPLIIWRCFHIIVPDDYAEQITLISLSVC
jgi:hypothetical protein